MIIEAKKSDVDAVVDIEQRAYPSPWTYGHFMAEFDKACSLFYVYKKHDILTGYIVLYDYEFEAEIANVAVHPEFQGQGIGKQLLEYGLSKLHKGTDVFLEVNRINETALTLYHRSGFKEISVRKNYYSDGNDAVIMQLKIT